MPKWLLNLIESYKDAREYKRLRDTVFKELSKFPNHGAHHNLFLKWMQDEVFTDKPSAEALLFTRRLQEEGLIEVKEDRLLLTNSGWKLLNWKSA